MRNAEDWRPSLRQYFRVALRYPIPASQFLLRLANFEEVVRQMVAKDLWFLRTRYNRMAPDVEGFLSLPQDAMQRVLGRLGPPRRENSGRMFSQWHSFLYAVTRCLRPRVVVETGVLYGFSSSAILQGLEDNRAGLLVSIDLPPSVQTGLLSTKHSVGSSVPFSLRGRWDLRLGNSLDVLPEILDGLGPISMFVHDSLHTYDHMTAEFDLAYKALERGGLLVSDDIDDNGAWADFCSSKGEGGTTLSKGLERNLFGFFVKSKDEK